LLAGSAVIEADSVEKDTGVTIVCKSGVVNLNKIGIYRFDAEPGRLKVFKGEASVRLGAESVEATLVLTGKMISLGGETASVEKFDVDDMDALDRWSSRRGMVLAMANPSAAKTASASPRYGLGGGIGMGGIGIGMGPGFGMGLGMGMGYCGWVWNPWYGVYTYVPCYGTYRGPYGYPYWSPYTVGGGFYRPVRNGGGVPPAYGRSNGAGGVNAGSVSSGPGIGRSAATTSSTGASGGFAGARTGGGGGGAVGGGGGGFSGGGGGHAGGGGVGGGGGGGHAGGGGAGGGGGHGGR